MSTTTTDLPVEARNALALKAALRQAGFTPGRAFRTVLMIPPAGQAAILGAFDNGITFDELAREFVKDFAERLRVTTAVAEVLQRRFRAATA